MLFLEVPPFDILTSQTEAYSGFGEVIVDSREIENTFFETTHRARERVFEVFGIHCNNAFEVPSAFEAMAKQMWAEGWSPNSDETNLLTTDFGCILFNALHVMFGGQFVFRSPSDLSHASLWWHQTGVEAFPFHKIFKRLLVEDGESISFFAESLKQWIKQSEV